MRDQGSNVCLGQQTKEHGIVHSRMCEKVFILGGQYCTAHDIRNFLIPNDVPTFAPQFDEDVTIRIVNVAHRRRLKANESIQIRKVSTIKVDVESCAYAEDQWNQNDSDNDPEYNTGRTIILRGNKCLA